MYTAMYTNQVLKSSLISIIIITIVSRQHLLSLLITCTVFLQFNELFVLPEQEHDQA